ncbi:MAG: hypothetical protein RLY58_2143 [Pseudomonadota bacterium]|jgi:hypothetical protein
MTYPSNPRSILRKRYPNLHEGQSSGEFSEESVATVNLHLNTRLSYVLGQSRAAPHRRVSNVIHRYGLLLGETIPRLREQFSELELAILTWAITDANTEHMNSRTFIGLMANMVIQRRQEGQLTKVPEEELDLLEDKLTALSLLDELALLDLVEQRLAKGM